MTAFCLRDGWAPWVALAGALALAGCRASVPRAGSDSIPLAPSSPSGLMIARYAESVPITALAVSSSHVWAGTERGLRRWRAAGKGAASDADDQPVGGETGFPGHRIDALGIDDEGAVWVASDDGVGRLSQTGGRLRYQARAAPPPSTNAFLAPTRADGGAWAAGAGGLARFDGRAWTALEFLRDVPVTSLELDADGQTAWVGTRGRGLFLVDAQGGKPILPPADGAAAALEEVVGTSPTPAGARVVAIRTADGGRIVLITKNGTETYQTQASADVRFVRLVAASAGPILLAAVGGVERAFDLRSLPRGESPPAGGFRLIDPRTGSVDRYQAAPLALAIPPEVTVTAVGPRGDGPPDLWCGSRQMGVAHAEAPRPRYLSGDLTDDADRLSVACVARDSCFVVAGGAHAWLFDGTRFRETRIGESAGGRALAVAVDHAGAIFGVVSDPPFEGIAITRWYAAAGNAAADKWEPVQRIPLGRSAVRPSVSFATFAPSGNLWLGMGAVASDGQEQGRGAIELAMSGPGILRVVRHGNFPGAEASPESLPLPYDLTSVLFDGTATWFSARSGINRWQESELRHWGENEHMDSEVCLDVAKGTDGKIWAATAAGVGRFDGAAWRFARTDDDRAAGKDDGTNDGPSTRALLNDGAGHMWLATAKGLRMLDAREASAPRLAPGTRIIDDDMLDLALDRFGRIWALGDAALAIVEGFGQSVRFGSIAAAKSGGTR
jgi:hypothetical protein